MKRVRFLPAVPTFARQRQALIQHALSGIDLACHERDRAFEHETACDEVSVADLPRRRNPFADEAGRNGKIAGGIREGTGVEERP